MTSDLSGPVARSSAAAAEDVLLLKRILNQLGYYTPHPKQGMSEWTDEALFDAVRAFQRDHDLFENGAVYPEDATWRALESAMDQAGESGRYIWHTVRDEHVRPDHAAREGHIFSWADHPKPGDDFNCRCWAEPIKNVSDVQHEELPPLVLEEKKDSRYKYSGSICSGRVGTYKTVLVQRKRPPPVPNR